MSRLDQILAELRADPKAVAEADSWNDGMQDGEHYAAVEIALADLHGKQPADLLGSDLLTTLYRLAKVHGEARETRLLEAAEVALQKEIDDGNEARSEARAVSRELRAAA